MSRVHATEIKRIKISEELFLELVSLSEKYSSWDDVYLVKDTGKKKIGSYYTDSIGGSKEWIEYNSNCVIFYSGNTYEDKYSVTKVFDINTMQSVDLSKEEIEEEYGIKVPDDIEIIKPIHKIKIRI